MQGYSIDRYSQNVERVCQNNNCQKVYTIGQYLEGNGLYFPRPFNYRAGCETYCLDCWLDVGPEDCLDGNGNVSEQRVEDPTDSVELLGRQDFSLTENDDGWPYEAVYELLMDGNVVPAFQWFLDKGLNLAIMPISRLHLERVIIFPGAITFYPKGVVDLDKLNLASNRGGKLSLAELCSDSSGITEEVLAEHPLIIFPCEFNWRIVRSGSHRSHMEFIRRLSEEIDRLCLNFVRYRSCVLEPVPDEGLPAHAGQVDSNHMMAGALLYCGALGEARVIGGAAFTHYLTRGLGLPLAQLEWDAFPREGEVGKIVNHALSLYAALLESPSPTIRFVQALSLLEFLAYPDEYCNFKEVKKVIARYVACDSAEYQRTLDRFHELTGKKDPSGRIIGYRTRVVHMGEQIEKLVPASQSMRQLFLELDGYIRPVIDHMIAHSEKTFVDYLKVRDTLCPFERGVP